VAYPRQHRCAPTVSRQAASREVKRKASRVYNAAGARGVPVPRNVTDGARMLRGVLV